VAVNSAEEPQTAPLRDGVGDSAATTPVIILYSYHMAYLRRVFALLAVLLLLLGSCAREGPDTGLPGIRLTDLRREVNALAADALGGREVGGEGIARAEARIARTFAALGLKPLPGRRGFYQVFSLYRTGFPAAGTALTLRTPAGEFSGLPGKDFRPFEFSGSGEHIAPVVFAGYGITAPEYDYDDYAGLEVAGRFVLVLRHEPGNTDSRSRFQGKANTRHAFFLAKAENARRRGAAGLLLVDDPLGSGEEDLSLQASWSLEPPAGGAEEPGRLGGFLAAHLSRDLAEKLLAGVESRETPPLGLRGLQQAVDAGARPAGFALEGAQAILRVPVLETRRLQARNVVGFLEGRDPAVRNQWLLIGAHHDHLGATNEPGDAIYNGADDNASGVAGVLALARLFARSGAWRPEDPALAGRRPAQGRLPPRRSLVFATFSAEEQGLFGAQVLSGELSGPGSQGRLMRMLNLDMIGRNPDDPVRILANDPGADLHRIVKTAAAALPVLPAPTLSWGGNEMASDHAAFFRRGTPYLFFFTGLHPDYHGVDDEAERLSYPRLAEVVRLAWRVASLLADAD
jgi:hypothetical protein